MAVTYSQNGVIVKGNNEINISRCSSNTFKIVDKNGYIGNSLDNLACNYCVIINDDYSNKGLGQVTFPNDIVINGKTYPTTIINNQQWTTLNLDLKWEGLESLSNDSSVPRADYYNQDESTYGWLGLKYGLLYNYTAYEYINNHLSDLGIPQGWRLTLDSDLRNLYSYIGVMGAKSINWDGTDLFGFNALPCGQYFNGFSDVGSYFQTWSYGSKYSSIKSGSSSSSNPTFGTDPSYAGHSIRLVKDL